ncbi:chromosome segregation protein SMC [Methylobacillus flagellatus]|uniref:chromosome segregation protein SMC n=1 Tax=Methylobacillus flagellatus TaxID=405 RepID=UPI0010F432D2|nr:chromosome segregation protein SMC [Methylobacillus flagellatus]
MRLTQLKLAGFKSFVDPTTLHLQGQRIGVVGPNGCGKSNIMEAMRWVLGESSAREMRGDTMDAVIFNGSGTRKAISRASVELVFDNSLGSANGEWGQYAEIAVKRVIERDKGSSYYINNSLVRRRDVADLFLGTGLGGRAYAIIGQNTISRIVEARPEELRVFLEEAAGISKYKERRRETELRLRDTRDNLARVQDILTELQAQIDKLESQAAVAREYQQLQQALALAQQQLALLQQRKAATHWEKTRQQVDKLVNALEAHIAALRHQESQLEQRRQQFQQASSALQAAQAGYYEANAALASLEQQIRHHEESQQRLQQQIQLLQTQQSRVQTQQQQLQERQHTLQQQAVQAGTTSAALQARLDNCLQGLPALEQAAGSSAQRHHVARQDAERQEQQLRLEMTQVSHLQTTLARLQQRAVRLDQERAQWVLPDASLIADTSRVLAELATQLTGLEQTRQHNQQQEQRCRDAIKLQQAARDQANAALTQCKAQIASLQKIQTAVASPEALQRWLAQHRLEQQPRLWQHIQIAPGWERALEAVLGARLNAVLADHTPAQRPPASLAILLSASDASISDATAVASLDPASPDPASLLGQLQVSDASLRIALASWLQGVQICADVSDLPAVRAGLQAGQVLVTQDGDIHDRHSICFHGAQSALQGVMERQRELQQLEAALPALQVALQTAHRQLAETETELQQLQQQARQLQQAWSTATQQQHQHDMQLQRLKQQQTHAEQRLLALQSEQTELQQQLQEADQASSQQQDKIAALEAGMPALQAAWKQAAGDAERAQQQVRQLREQRQQLERELQQQTFSGTVISNQINDLKDRLKAGEEELASLAVQQHNLQTQLQSAPMLNLRVALEQALQHKQQREAALADSRNQLAEVEQQLQTEDRNRMQLEQQSHPQRDRLEQARLQEQQARLEFEQFRDALLASAVDLEQLETGLPRGADIAWAQQQCQQWQQQIEALGAVNLAAISELESQRERKHYLQSQSTDLQQATDTLEDAIRRIDRETRARLQDTFDRTNTEFGELFSVLFAGGHARLELLGDEILDTGMQVFAQPPGKKNSTIHLLSGGEKALTALALVFALFRLNPAPFCLMDEVDAPLDDSNTERFCAMVKKMSERTQFLFVSHNKITMEMAQQLVGVTMQESGVSRVVEVDLAAAMQLHEEVAA